MIESESCRVFSAAKRQADEPPSPSPAKKQKTGAVQRVSRAVKKAGFAEKATKPADGPQPKIKAEKEAKPLGPSIIKDSEQQLWQISHPTFIRRFRLAGRLRNVCQYP